MTVANDEEETRVPGVDGRPAVDPIAATDRRRILDRPAAERLRLEAVETVLKRLAVLDVDGLRRRQRQREKGGVRRAVAGDRAADAHRPRLVGDERIRIVVELRVGDVVAVLL